MTSSVSVVHPPDCLDPFKHDLLCRICLQEGSLNIYESSFDTEDGEIHIADAISVFSSIQVYV